MEKSKTTFLQEDAFVSSCATSTTDGAGIERPLAIFLPGVRHV